MNNINELAGLQYNLGDIIRQNIAQSFIVDYGIVKAVNADKTVDVTHAVQGQYIDGTAVPSTVSTAVEVIFPGSASAAITWPIAVGDGVLLVGLKQFVSSTKGIQVPSQPPSDFPHYNQETLKAIPLQNISAPAFQINVDASALGQIKNNSQSLFTLLDSFDSHMFALATALLTFTTGLNAGTLVAQSAAMATASATAIANIATDRANLALLLKA